VTHSLVDCVALAIETPVGVVIHTGDFKIDLSPLDDTHSTCTPLPSTASAACWRCLQDSTNVERSGYTPERARGDSAARRGFSQTKKKLFFTCFSSSIYRIRIAMELARKHGRKVASSAAP
jgi:ribonuclease J